MRALIYAIREKYQRFIARLALDTNLHILSVWEYEAMRNKLVRIEELLVQYRNPQRNCVRETRKRVIRQIADCNADLSNLLSKAWYATTITRNR